MRDRGAAKPGLIGEDAARDAVAERGPDGRAGKTACCGRGAEGMFEDQRERGRYLRGVGGKNDEAAAEIRDRHEGDESSGDFGNAPYAADEHETDQYGKD